LSGELHIVSPELSPILSPVDSRDLSAMLTGEDSQARTSTPLAEGTLIVTANQDTLVNAVAADKEESHHSTTSTSLPDVASLSHS
jgi:hypothetical protein